MIGAASILGTLPAWLTVGGVLAAAFIFYRGGGGTAIQSLQAANQVLERRVHDQEIKLNEQDKVIAELRGRTDVSLVAAPLIEAALHHEERSQNRYEQHELRAQQRHDQTVGVLGQIANAMGAEPNDPPAR